jgi:ubiquitin carboxyl-terminal hydrolase L3
MKYFTEGATVNPEQRAKLLEKSDELEVAHQEVATEAKSDASHVINDNLHFIALVEKDGKLWELDGRKEFPIDHGPSSPDSLLEDAIRVVQEFMARDPDDVRFNMVSLGPAMEE